MRIDKSHNTAISRKKLSAPVKWLYDNLGFPSLTRFLDYGCGRGTDAAFLRNDFTFVEQYDPQYFPVCPTGFFDIIFCTYVLNVLPKEKEQEVLNKIKARLLPGGVSYIAVRRDLKVEGYRKKGTYQRNVKLDLPLVYERKGRFAIYILS
jgi:hypothetical protein